MFRRTSELGSCSYFLANRRCFFFRFGDSGFRNKWCGLWKQGKKVAEYFAVKVNGEWLSPQNASGLEYNFSEAIHTYSTGSGTVRETLFIPEDSDALVVCIECERDAEIEVKPAVNIRLLHENVTRRKYGISEGEGFLKVSNGVAAAFLESPEESLSFTGREKYCEHSPAGEKQNYFVPRNMKFRGSRAVFTIGAERCDARDWRSMLKMKSSAYRKLVRGVIKSNKPSLPNAFECAVLSLELLRKEGGFYAGLPWFQQFWGRDTFWSLPAVISLGWYEDARKILRFFADNSDSGRIPNFVPESGERTFNSIDATPLWIMSLERYVRSSGDTDFLRSVEGTLSKTLEFLSSRSRGGFLKHDADKPETWMDTQLRCCSAVEVQSLYYGALGSACRLFRILGKDDKKLHAKAEWIKKNFSKSFLSEGFYADRIERGKRVDSRTANAFVPAFLGPGKPTPSVLREALEPGFLSGRGIRTLSSREGKYDPEGYHTGSAWSLTTAWAAAAQFAGGRPEEGWSLMKCLIEDVEGDGLGCVGECWDPENGRLTGCPLQLWGCAFIIMLVDDFMLGMHVDSLKNEITVSPRIPRCINRMERRVWTDKEEVKLTFRRGASSVSVSCSSPEVKLIKK